jgi:hypothetical protein
VARDAFGGYLRVIRQALADAASAGAARGAGLRPPAAAAAAASPEELPGAPASLWCLAT